MTMIVFFAALAIMIVGDNALWYQHGIISIIFGRNMVTLKDVDNISWTRYLIYRIPTAVLISAITCLAKENAISNPVFICTGFTLLIFHAFLLWFFYQLQVNQKKNR